MRPIRCFASAAFLAASFLMGGCTPSPEPSPNAPATAKGSEPTQPVKGADSGAAPDAKTGEGS